MPWSSTATTASIGRRASRATITSLAAAGSDEGHDDGAIAHAGRHRLRFLGSDHHLDAEVGRGAHEVGRPVGGGGQQEEDAGHGRIIAGMSELLTITEEARAKVLEVRAAETDADSLALWVEVSGEQAGAYTYLMEFRPVAELPGTSWSSTTTTSPSRFPPTAPSCSAAPRSSSTAAW